MMSVCGGLPPSTAIRRHYVFFYRGKSALMVAPEQHKSRYKADADHIPAKSLPTVVRPSSDLRRRFGVHPPSLRSTIAQTRQFIA